MKKNSSCISKLTPALKTTTLTLFLAAALTTLKAQVPGTWNPSPATTTQNAVGIGIINPAGWQEISYCSEQQKGLVITNTVCPLLPARDFPLTFDGLIEAVAIPGEPGGGGGGGVFVPYPVMDFTLKPFGAFTNNNPMLWARMENHSTFLGTSSGTYSSRFIVTPGGTSGVNIEVPRATFDVKSLGWYNYPGMIVGRQALGITGRTRHTMFVPMLELYGYNRISRKDDQGMFFTDGKGADGSNLDGAFIIAPWSSNTMTGGLRMDKDGNVELRGELQTLLVKTRAQWWPDFVFHKSYNLMNLYDLEKYISQHSHLPGIPSEKEMIDNGIVVNEIVPLQQQKIEELTLYTIEQQKQIDGLASEIELLKKQIDLLLKK